MCWWWCYDRSNQRVVVNKNLTKHADITSAQHSGIANTNTSCFVICQTNSYNSLKRGGDTRRNGQLSPHLLFINYSEPPCTIAQPVRKLTAFRGLVRQRSVRFICHLFSNFSCAPLVGRSRKFSLSQSIKSKQHQDRKLAEWGG